MKIKEEISKILARFVPTSIRLVQRGKQEPPASSHLIDVDVLHGYLRMAEAGDTTQLFGLYRDILAGHSHTQGEFSKRKLAVLGDAIALVPVNPDDAAEAAWVASLQAHLLDRPGWVQFLSHCLDSTLYPVALTERSYRASIKPGWRYELAEMRPVPHVHLAWPYGQFSIKETDDDGNFLGTFSVPNTRCYIVHTGHLLSSVPDWWGGPMRALVFWWLFATMDRDWWARFLDRFGSPFLIGKYDENDSRAQYELESAFSSAVKIFGMAVTKDTEVQMHQANSQGGGEAFEKFQAFANGEISKLIVGQPGSASSSGPKIGGDGQASAQADVRDDIRKYDAATLAHTIKTQIIAPLCYLNGWTFPLPNVSFGTDEQEAEITGELLASLFQAGLQPTDDGITKIAKRIGFGIQRIPSLPAGIALSARPAMPLLPTVARRAARAQQARRAVEALTASASPKLARLMRDRSLALAAAIDAADSPESAAAAVAALAADYDPGAAADLVTAVLTSSAVNAVLALD